MMPNTKNSHTISTTTSTIRGMLSTSVLTRSLMPAGHAIIALPAEYSWRHRLPVGTRACQLTLLLYRLRLQSSMQAVLRSKAVLSTSVLTRSLMPARSRHHCTAS